MYHFGRVKIGQNPSQLWEKNKIEIFSWEVVSDWYDFHCNYSLNNVFQFQIKKYYLSIRYSRILLNISRSKCSLKILFDDNVDHPLNFFSVCRGCLGIQPRLKNLKIQESVFWVIPYFCTRGLLNDPNEPVTIFLRSITVSTVNKSNWLFSYTWSYNFFLKFHFHGTNSFIKPSWPEENYFPQNDGYPTDTATLSPQFATPLCD